MGTENVVCPKRGELPTADLFTFCRKLMLPKRRFSKAKCWIGLFDALFNHVKSTSKRPTQIFCSTFKFFVWDSSRQLVPFFDSFRQNCQSLIQVEIFVEMEMVKKGGLVADGRFSGGIKLHLSNYWNESFGRFY